MTDHGYWKKGKWRVPNRAFTGRAIASPKLERPWGHELSGRLLSLTQDLNAEAEDFCARFKRRYSGAMYCQVATLRGLPADEVTTNVIFTPNVTVHIPRHCEERSDEATQGNRWSAAAPGLLRSARNDGGCERLPPNADFAHADLTFVGCNEENLQESSRLAAGYGATGAPQMGGKARKEVSIIDDGTIG